jgi:uncharacterized protein (TIGR03435 family)
MTILQRKPLMLMTGIGALALQAQTPGAPVRYEAASIKPVESADMRRPLMELLPGGRFRSVSFPILPVFALAYNTPWQSIEASRLRIKGMPDWMISDPYDIEAVAEKGSLATGVTAKERNERMRLMLQSVLTDRLKLRVRRELTEMPVYALVVEKGGPRLERAKIAEEACTEAVPGAPISASTPACHQFQGGSGRGIFGVAVDLSDLAAHVSNWTDRPVVDQTGLTGLYTIRTSGWSESAGDPSRPTLDQALEPLGLRLVSKKAAVEVFIIEHVEKPSAN